jgi:hypothetical protein
MFDRLYTTITAGRIFNDDLAANLFCKCPYNVFEANRQAELSGGMG